MNTTSFFAVALLSTAVGAQGDFSYTATRRTVGGHSVAGDIYQMSKLYFKGRKMKVDGEDITTIVDFDAKTTTTIDNKLKTISVAHFSDPVSQVGTKVDVRETGQKKAIHGLEAREFVLNVDIDSPELRLTGRRMRMEMDAWLSEDVAGAGEWREFYQKNRERFPWALMGGGGDQAIQGGLVNLQRRVAEMNGVPVIEVVKVRDASGGAAPAVPQLNSAQSAQMREAMAQLDVIRDRGGQEGAAAGEAIAHMSAMTGGPSPATSLFEITVESSDFSAAAVPDAVFGIPPGYQKVDQK